MSFYLDGRELGSRAPRTLSYFERGFHDTAVSGGTETNPYPACTVAESDWEQGRNLYLERKKRLVWKDPKKSPPGPTNVEAGVTFLCLVEDSDGYYVHRPCWTIGLTLGGAVVWHPYVMPGIRRVIEYAHVPMTHPERVNAMQTALNWAST